MPFSAVRMPAVAGQFYPSDPEILNKSVDQHLGPAVDAAEKLNDAKACVAPHAGYRYSGHVAGAVYRKLPALSSYIILGPNHFGQGEPLAIYGRGHWQTPLGLVPIDEPLAQSIQRHCEMLVEDAEAHAQEHSLEVQLPFLQRLIKGFAFVPIAVGAVSYEALEALGRGIAQAVKESGQPELIIASSDMNHYEPDDITRIKDRKAIDQIVALDPRGLYEVVGRERISMCGYGPTVAMLSALRELGGREAMLAKYATSADAGGDRRRVVGYAGIIIR